MNDEYQVMSEEERIEEERWERAVDPETGEFRNLEAYYEYYPEEAIPLYDGDPSPSDYGVHQEDQFKQDLALIREKKATKEAMKESILEAEAARYAPDPSIPDDGTESERLAIINRINDYEYKATKAKERNETRPGYRQFDYEQRIIQERKELEKLGPPMGERVQAERAFAHEAKQVKQLIDPKIADAPMWKSDRMKGDAGIALSRYNSRAKDIIILPVEKSRFGNVEEVTPQTVIAYDLPTDVLKRFQRDVYSSGKTNNPSEVFKESHRWLHKMGYASHGKRVVMPKKEAEAKEPEKKKPEMNGRNVLEKTVRPGMFGAK